MTQNYLRKLRRVFTFVSFLLASVLFGANAMAQTYTNGVLSTGATALNGTAAPAGKTWSEAQNVTGNTTVANSTGGVSAQTGSAFTAADDFTITGASWNLTKIRVYAYSTGFTGSTSPFTDVRIVIHSGTPTGPVVFGDLTTNRLSASGNTNVLRTFNTLVPPSAPGTTRTIWSLDANVSVTLAAGTYWLEFQTGITGATSNFVPLSSPVGVRTLPGYNAQQSNAGTFAGIFDTGVDQSQADAGQPVAMDLPFQIAYTTGACMGTPAPGNTIASAAAVCAGTAFSLSLQNATNGGGVSYQWQSSATGVAGSFTNIAGATNATYSVTNLAATTFYQAVVTCSGSSATSTPVQVMLNPPSACYCIPGIVNCNLDDQIQRVLFGGIDNSSTCSPNGYGDYTALPAGTVIAGGPNPISVKVGPGGTEQVVAWIDYNKNGVFEASEYSIIGSGNNVTIDGAINVPASAPLGTTRMRIRVRFLTIPGAGDACTTAGGFGEVEDYTVKIAACVPVVVTAQPVDKSVSCGGSTTFSLTATGSFITYQWQQRATATAPWVNLTNGGVYSGTNAATLTLSNVPTSFSGYQYRVIYTGACSGTDFSSVSTLTVTPLLATVSTIPTGPVVICKGTIVPITITNPASASVVSGTNSTTTLITDNDPSGVNSNISLTGIPVGANITKIEVVLNINHTYVGDLLGNLKSPSGDVLNLFFALNGATGGNSTANFTNTVFSSSSTTAISGAAAPRTGTFAAEGYSLTLGGVPITTVNTFNQLFNKAVNGNWTLNLADLGAGDEGNLLNWTIKVSYGAAATGVFTSSPSTPNSMFTNPAATIPYTGTAINTIYVKPDVSTTYNVVVTTPLCTSSSLAIPVTVRQAATSVSAVANKAVCIGGTTTFTSTIVGGLNNELQWQVSKDGGATYTNITNGGVYSGATTSTLTITGVTADMTNYLYRVVVGAAPCAASSTLTSAAGKLTVNPKPVVVLAANPVTALFPGLTTTLTAAVSPNAAATYSWTYNGAPLAGVTGNTYVVNINGLGAYKVSVNDVNGCSGTSNTVTITDSATTSLFIYPNPTSGVFHVRFYGDPLDQTFTSNRKLVVYDSKGARVYTKVFSYVGPYTDMVVDLSNVGKGIYHVDLLNNVGERLKTGRIMVQY